MECQLSTEKLELLLDGELDVEEQKRLMDHINHCSKCYQFYNAEKSLRQALQTKLPRKVVPRTTVDTIRSHIQKIA